MNLEILDTAGTEQFTAMRDMYLKSGQGFLLVYSITSGASMHDVVALHDRLVKVKGSGSGNGLKVILVGNKSDLAEERAVSRKQGQELADKWGCLFVETTAKQWGSVEGVFMSLIGELEKPKVLDGDCCGSSSANNGRSSNHSGSEKGKKKRCIIY